MQPPHIECEDVIDEGLYFIGIASIAIAALTKRPPIHLLKRYSFLLLPKRYLHHWQIVCGEDHLAKRSTWLCETTTYVTWHVMSQQQLFSVPQ